MAPFKSDQAFLRSKAGSGFAAYLVGCAFVSVVVAIGFYQLNFKLFERNKGEEKLTALQLVDAFVTEYSDIRTQSLAAEAPVPATLRAHAIERFNSKVDLTKSVAIRWVGVPGREIATAPGEPGLADTIRRLAQTTDPKPVTEFVGSGDGLMLRTVFPSVAAQQSCVDCHNRLQAGKVTWKLGDLMGAFSLEVPAGAFLRENLLTASAVGAGMFLLLGGIGFYISLLHYRQLAHQRAAQASLRESEERFRDFAETASDWFWEQDADLRFSYVANAVSRSGLPAHDHIGKLRWDVVTLGVTDEQWAAHKADLAARRPFQGFHFQRLDEEGRVHHVRIDGRPMFAADGTFRGYRGSARDVTAEVLAEQELERRVEARTGELRQAQAELIRSERMATLGRITATVSHELRNPLGVIRNTMFTIAEAVRAAGLKLDRPLQRVERSISRCDVIIGELLDYTRGAALRREPVPIDALLAELLDEQQLPDGIALLRDLGAPGVVLSVDPNRFRRAVINLVENAAQAIKEHVEKTGDAKPHSVLVRSAVIGGRFEVLVKDTGPGIPEEVFPKIFEPLFSTKGFGVGLGLPTVKQILEHHGGDVTMSTRPGEGAEALLWVPLESPSEAAA
jgi:PAS domain S-box-containing protein